MDGCICSEGIRFLSASEGSDVRPSGGYGASVEYDGSDPLRFAVLTTGASVSTALRRPAVEGRVVGEGVDVHLDQGLFVRRRAAVRLDREEVAVRVERVWCVFAHPVSRTAPGDFLERADVLDSTPLARSSKIAVQASW